MKRRERCPAANVLDASNKLPLEAVFQLSVPNKPKNQLPHPKHEPPNPINLLPPFQHGLVARTAMETWSGLVAARPPKLQRKPLQPAPASASSRPRAGAGTTSKPAAAFVAAYSSQQLSLAIHFSLRRRRRRRGVVMLVISDMP